VRQTNYLNSAEFRVVVAGIINLLIRLQPKAEFSQQFRLNWFPKLPPSKFGDIENVFMGNPHIFIGEPAHHRGTRTS